MNSKIRKSIALLAVATGFTGFATTAHSQIVKTGSGYTMKMKWVKGTTMNYVMSMNMTGMPTNQKVPSEIPFSMKIVDVKGDVATIKYGGGMMGNQDITVQMDSSGKVISGKGMENMGMSGMTGASLPKKAVAVGETWKTSQTANTAMGKMTVNGTYKFLGLKNMSGKQVAEIAVTVTSSGQSMSVNGSGTMHLLASDGSLFLANLNQNVKAGGGQGGQPMNMKMGITIKRK